MERSTSTLDIIATFCRVLHIQNHWHIEFIGDFNFTLKTAGPTNLQFSKGYYLLKPKNSLSIEV